MEKCITKEYIETSEVDRMIYEDKELYGIIKEQISEDTTKRVVFATITIILGIVKFILNCRPPKGIEAYRILDNKMTNTIKQLVGDNTIRVYLLRSDMVNAFNIGTSDIYYTDQLIKKLSITENELIGICLHEYGHYVGKHDIKTEAMSTATGIIIPILLREIVKEFPMFVTFFLGKIVSHMVSSRIRIIVGRPQEYFSDSYAAKKGYGRHLITALNKMNKYVRRIACKDKSKEECDMLMNRISKIDEHPTVEKRVDNILKSSKIKSIISSGRFELLVRFLDRIRGLFGR